MPLHPLTYIRSKRDAHHSSKPSALSKIATRASINQQRISPLFHSLPSEIRYIVFKYALIATPDPSNPYSPHSFYYRPGYTHGRQIATALLLTCRRIYIETHFLPISLNEHIRYCGEVSHAPPINDPLSSHRYFNRLNPAQRATIQYVHLFCQQYWLEDWVSQSQWGCFADQWGRWGGPCELRITIRHSDWWYYLLGERSPLALDAKRAGRVMAGEWAGEDEAFEEGCWGSRFQNLRGLRVFELELETVKTKKDDLDAVVNQAGKWKFPLGDGNVLVMDEKATESYEWRGSKYVTGLNAPDVPAGLQLPQARKGSLASLRTVKSRGSDTERAVLREDTGKTGLGEEHELEYYVVTMTWRAQTAPVRQANSEEERQETVTRAQPARVAPAPASMTEARGGFSIIPTYYGSG